MFEAAVGPVPFHLEHHLSDAADAGLAGVDYVGLPTLALRVASVHPEQVGREKAGFLATCSGPDLQYYVLLVVGVPWEQGVGQLSIDGVLSRLQAVQLLLGQCRELLVRLIAKHGADIVELPQDLSVVPRERDEVLDRCLLLDQVLDAGVVRRELGVGEETVDLVVALFYRGQPF